MASVAFGIGAAIAIKGGAVAGVTAGSIAASVLTTVATAVGTAIDQALIFPALFPPEDQVGPRFNEFRIQSSEEGSNLNFCLGPENRVAGTVIWLAPPYEVRNETSEGGKGGNGTRVLTYEYYADIAVGVCGYHEIEEIDYIWAEGKLLYDTNPEHPDVSSDQFDLVAVGAIPSLWAIGATPVGVLNAQYAQVSSPSGSPDLSIFRNGVQMTVSGYANSNNNGTFMCAGSNRNSDGSSWVVFTRRIDQSTVLPGAFVTENAPGTITLQQTLPNAVAGDLGSLTIYKGTSGQAADPLIVSYEDPSGSGNVVPAWPGLCYIVIERLRLRNFGNRIPQLSFFVKADTSLTTGSAISAFMDRADRSGQYDVSQCTDTLKGYNVFGPSQTAKNLQPLMIAYNLLDQERNGIIHFFPRDKAQIHYIDTKDLRAHLTGTDLISRLDISDADQVKIPQAVAIRFLDHQQDYQYGSITAGKNNAASDETFKIDLPLVLDQGGDEAHEIGQRILWYAYVNRQLVTLQLPPKYLYLLENDVIRFTLDDFTWTLLIRKIDITRDYLMILDCMVEERSVAYQVGVADDPEGARVFQLPSPYVLTTNFIEPTIITGAPTGTPSAPPAIIGGNPHYGMAVGVPFLGDNEEFISATVYMSHEYDGTYEPVAQIESTTPMGNVDSAPGDATPGIWDYINSIDVTMFHGDTLVSVTELECLNGLNRCYVGHELIGYQTATLIGTDQYRLTNLLRGLADTTDEMADHEDDERFVSLENPSSLTFISAPFSQIGQLRYYRVVSYGGNVDDHFDEGFYLEGKSIQPWGPSSIQYDDNGDVDNDIELSWIRRTRFSIRIFQEATIPLDEPFEKYEVDILHPAGGSTVVRTIEVQDATSVTYTAAQRSTDSTVNSAFDVRVYQISPTAGRGRSLELLEVPALGS